MKTRVHDRGFRRKAFLIFIFAIIVPSMFVGYLSVDTILRRRDAVNRLLESNLWISGEAALQRCEAALLEFETEMLSDEHLTELMREPWNPAAVTDSLSRSGAGIPFLLDKEFRIVYPSVVPENSPKSILRTTDQLPGLLNQAESLEYSQQNYNRAIETYRSFLRSTPVEQRPIALEGLGRCLFAVKDYPAAVTVYEELIIKYSQVGNRAGHPYGITAHLRLASIEKSLGLNEKSIGRLVSLYSDVRNGKWILNRPSYLFFITAIESEIQNQVKAGLSQDLLQSFQIQKEKYSNYEATLQLIELVEKSIPSIRDKITISQGMGESGFGRFPIMVDSVYSLISFHRLPPLREDRIFIGGFVWDLKKISGGILLPELETLSRESGLRFDLITPKQDPVKDRTRTFSFATIPLPWKLSVTQTGIDAVQDSARRDMVLYGSLLTVIIVLMIFGAILIFRDMAREAETTRLKTEFVHNISHELKTPLTLIRLYGETLQRKKNLTQQEKKESYEIITKESERLSHLVNNVLDFSRIEMGRKEFHMKTGNLADVVEDTVESYRYHLEKKGFVIHLEIAEDVSEISFDPEAIASVVVNLLSNVIKFSPVEKEVWIRLNELNDMVILQVTDKGIGIDPKDRKRIFQRFYRSKDKAVSETSGSGLGLPLVKHIVEAHGGRIVVESEAGKGSTFSVHFPVSTKKGISA